MDINKINWESLKEDTQVAIDHNYHQKLIWGSFDCGENVASLEQDLQYIEEKNVKALQDKYGKEFFNDFFD